MEDRGEVIPNSENDCVRMSVCHHSCFENIISVWNLVSTNSDGGKSDTCFHRSCDHSCLTASNNIQQQPTTANNIQQHPTTSNSTNQIPVFMDIEIIDVYLQEGFLVLCAPSDNCVPPAPRLTLGFGTARPPRLWVQHVPSCCHHVAIMSPPCRHHHVAIMLPSCCHHVAVMLPSCCHHVATMLPSCCRHVATMLPSCCHHVAIMLPPWASG